VLLLLRPQGSWHRKGHIDLNQLSWLLYIGNVVGNLGPLFFTLGLGCLLLAALMVISSVENFTKSSLLKALFPTAIAVVFWFMAALCPSQETVYAIAASQMGEQALKTPMASKAGQALEAWLDKQIKDNKSEEH
jgi:predicted branched-subunit amino acid permease